MFMEFITGRF